MSVVPVPQGKISKLPSVANKSIARKRRHEIASFAAFNEFEPLKGLK